VAGEIDSGADFYDYDAKYITDTSVAYIPARIPKDVENQLREMAVRIYTAIGCRGLSRVDFFVTYKGNQIVFNEINTLPGFTSISMYPKLFAASGIAYEDLIDQLRGNSRIFEDFRHFSTNTPREKGGFYETNRKRLQRLLLFDRGRLDLQRTKREISKRQGWIPQAAQI
jgi:hypothetical protein